MSNDFVADLLVRINNAQRVGHPTVKIKHSKLNRSILKLLKEEGFVGDFTVVRNEETKFDEFKVALRYDRHGMPLIRQTKRVSKSGRRVYVGKDGIPKIQGGLGLAIVSTSQGVLTDREAKKRGIGGEVLGIVS